MNVLAKYSYDNLGRRTSVQRGGGGGSGSGSRGGGGGGSGGGGGLRVGSNSADCIGQNQDEVCIRGTRTTFDFGLLNRLGIDAFFNDARRIGGVGGNSDERGDQPYQRLLGPGETGAMTTTLCGAFFGAVGGVLGAAVAVSPVARAAVAGAAVVGLVTGFASEVIARRDVDRGAIAIGVTGGAILGASLRSYLVTPSATPPSAISSAVSRAILGPAITGGIIGSVAGAAIGTAICPSPSG